ncbi:MAG: RNA methyltransferase [Acidobacteriaceae bacterium]|nr:RNA methyltransferase [Acidobacteriaceae bacterium]MBV9498529.1 RNA methyltransferase [Acidobacteriaceae bacterium]
MPNWPARNTIQLTSTKNPRLQAVRKATSTGRPTEDGLIVIEGPHLLEETYGSSWGVEQIFTTAQGLERHEGLFRQTDSEIIQLPPAVFRSIATTESPQDVLALVRPREWTWEEICRPPRLIVVLDRVQDPGNAGTVMRSAEAFGASGMVMLSGSARISNAKVMRATAGSLFRMPLVEEVLPGEMLERLGPLNVALFALGAQGTNAVSEVDFRQDCAIIAGNEGSGVSEELLKAARQVSIRTCRVESLNAAVACSIALYEAACQRARDRDPRYEPVR